MATTDRSGDHPPKQVTLVDLVGEIEGPSFSIKSPEHPEERASRLRSAEADAAAQRFKDLALFVLTGLTMVAVGGVAVSIVLGLVSQASADEKKWATALLTSLATGLAGYRLGKSGTRGG